MRNFLAVVLMVAGLAAKSAAAPVPSGCPSCIINTAAPQNAQINIGTATIRGTLTVGTMSITNLAVTSATAAQFIGGGAGITGLNASQLLSGVVATARMIGSYTGITGLGTIATGVWNGTPVSSQYGGTGQDFSTVLRGYIPFFNGTGTWSTLAPGASGRLLQTNGSGADPSWTAAPSILGTNVTAIPPANLAAGTLPSNVAVNNASIVAVSGSKVSGNITGTAGGLTDPLPLNELEPGTLPTTVAASSITPTGVTAGTYGSASQSATVVVRGDGRLQTVSQQLIAINPTAINAGALPGNVTVPATSLTPGLMAAGVRPQTLTATGVSSGTYGGPTQAAQITISTEGRVTSAEQFWIPGVSTWTAMKNEDNAWPYAQTSISSWTFKSDVGVQGTLALTNPLAVTSGGTGQNWGSIAAGRVPYFTGAGVLGTLATSVNGYVLTQAGGVPTWAASSSSATHLAGGGVGQIPFQSAANSTTFLPAIGAGGIITGSATGAFPSTGTLTGIANRVTVTQTGSNIVLSGPQDLGTGNSPTFVTVNANLAGNATTATTATNIAGGAANSLPYQTGAGATSLLAAGTGVLQEVAAGAPAWTLTPTLTGTNFSAIPQSAVTNLVTDLAAKASSGTNSDITSLGALTSITTAGTLSVSSNVIINSGQVYNAPTGVQRALEIRGATTVGKIGLWLSSYNSSYGPRIGFTDETAYNYGFGMAADGTGDLIWNSGNNPTALGTERMRLTQAGALSTSGNVTASSVTVNNTASGDFIRHRYDSGHSGGLGVWAGGSNWATGIWHDGGLIGSFQSNGGLGLGTYASAANAPSNGLAVSGLVGLNTATPSANLDVNGNAQFGSGVGRSTHNADGTITVRPTSDNTGITLQETDNANNAWTIKATGAGSFMQFYRNGATNIYFDSNPSADNYINSGGKFGIGTNAPGTMLHVKPTTNVNWRFTDDGAGAARLNVLNDAADTYVPLDIRAGDITLNAAGSGNILINGGTGAKLAVGGGNIRLDNNQGLEWGGTNNFISGNEASDFIDFYTNGAKALRLDSFQHATFSSGVDISSLTLALAAQFTEGGFSAAPSNSGRILGLTDNGLTIQAQESGSARHFTLMDGQGNYRYLSVDSNRDLYLQDSGISGGDIYFGNAAKRSTYTVSTGDLGLSGGLSAQLTSIGANTGQIVLKKSNGELTTDSTQLTWDSASDVLSVNGLVVQSNLLRVAGSGTLSIKSANGDGVVALATDTGESAGIGTATPATKLAVIGSGVSVASSGSGSDADGRMRFYQGASYGSIDNYKTSSGYMPIAIYASGLGVDTIAPSTKLDVNGNAQFGSGATKSTFTATGQLFMAPGASIFTGPDTPYPGAIAQTGYGNIFVQGKPFSAGSTGGQIFFDDRTSAGTIGMYAGLSAYVQDAIEIGGTAATAPSGVALFYGSDTVNKVALGAGNFAPAGNVEIRATKNGNDLNNFVLRVSSANGTSLLDIIADGQSTFSGNLFAPVVKSTYDNDVTNPAFGSSNDTNTGIYFPASNTVGIACGGDECMSISDTTGVAISSGVGWVGGLTVAGQVEATTFKGNGALLTGLSGMSAGSDNIATGSNNWPTWKKYTKTYADFSAAALTNTITLETLPANSVIHGIKIKHSTAFSGTGITAYTISVGTGTGAGSQIYASPYNVFQTVSSSATQLSDTFSTEGSATYNLTATATSVGANLNAASGAGSVDIWVLKSVTP